MDTYDISNDPGRLDLDAMHAYLSSSYWSPGIPKATLAKAVAHSICVGAYCGAKQVGFARMVTDRATFAYLADVYVLEPHRGRGLAQRLIKALLAEPEMQGLRRLMLVTRDGHRLYQKFGFQALAAPERFMERHDPRVYLAADA